MVEGRHPHDAFTGAFDNARTPPFSPFPLPSPSPPPTRFVCSGVGQLPGLLIWRIESLAPVPVDKSHHGRFYSGDAYVLLHTRRVWPKLSHEVYFWLGESSTVDEQGAAAVLTLELDAALGGAAAQHREVEGHETAGFLSALPGGRIEYLPGGARNGCHHTRAERYTMRLLSVKGMVHARVRQVPPTAASLSQGEVFVLDMGSTLYAWSGEQAHKRERTRALEVCRGLREERMRASGMPSLVLMDSCSRTEAEAFWFALGGKPVRCQPFYYFRTEHKRLQKLAMDGGVLPAKAEAEEGDGLANGSLQLWRLSEPAGIIEEAVRRQHVCCVGTQVAARPLMREMLDASDAFILVTAKELWVWVGSKAVKVQRDKAMVYAQSFLKGKKRDPRTPVTRVVQDAEPTLFTSRFVNWPSYKGLSLHAARLMSVAPLDGNRGAAEPGAIITAAESIKLLPSGEREGKLRVWKVDEFKKHEVRPYWAGSLAWYIHGCASG
ncbi:MAG: hypothetical protein SGPRY_012675 [Prymnesium sp.]